MCGLEPSGPQRMRLDRECSTSVGSGWAHDKDTEATRIKQLPDDPPTPWWLYPLMIVMCLFGLWLLPACGGATGKW